MARSRGPRPCAATLASSRSTSETLSVCGSFCHSRGVSMNAVGARVMRRWSSRKRKSPFTAASFRATVAALLEDRFELRQIQPVALTGGRAQAPLELQVGEVRLNVFAHDACSNSPGARAGGSRGGWRRCRRLLRGRGLVRVRGLGGLESILALPPEEVAPDGARLRVELAPGRTRRQFAEVAGLDLPIDPRAALDDGSELRAEIFRDQALEHRQLIERFGGGQLHPLRVERLRPEPVHELPVPVVEHQVVLAVAVERRHRLGVVLEVDDRGGSYPEALGLAGELPLDRLATGERSKQ